MREDDLMGRLGRVAILLLVGGALSSGCTVTMYPGPRRPSAQTAAIQQAGASIESIDRMAVPVGSTFVVLPGVHTIEAKPTAGAEGVTVCFLARAGHAYRVAGDGAQVVIMDGADVGMRTYRLRDGQICDQVVADAEAERRAARRRPPPTPVASVPAEPSSAPPAPEAADQTGVETQLPAAPPARSVARSANDEDTPSGRQESDHDEPVMPRPRPFRPAPHRLSYRDDPDEPPPRKPVMGLMFEFGMGGGGADLASVTLTDGSTQTLSAGDGVVLAVGLMCTPLWFGDDLGIGFSATAGVKYWDVGASNGDISMTRFPLTFALHLMPRVAPRWFLFLRGGIDKEVDVSISGSGLAAGLNADLNANLGGFGEGGFYNIFATQEQRGAWSLTFRYTKITYTAGYESANGQSFMLFSNFYYNP